jgi:uncharacterized protein YbjT (DUF2867 family)
MQAGMKIGVVGATGRVGHHVVEVLRERGHDVVPMARSLGVDVATGEGLAEALRGVECVIDAASWHSPDQAEATAFFLNATRNLQTMGQRAGVRRLVVVSIIGIDQFTSGYYAAKQAQERAVREGPLPARILRAAQFHEFVGPLTDWSRQGDRILVPKMRTQLVSARTVAEALTDMATDAAFEQAPANAPIAEIAGPREERLADAARLLMRHRGETAVIEEVTDSVLSSADNPDTRLYESGALLPSPHARLAGPTFEEWVKAGEHAPALQEALRR